MGNSCIVSLVQIFGSSFVLLDVFFYDWWEYSFFVHYSLRLAIIQLVSFCFCFLLSYHPLAYLRSKKEKGQGRYLVLLHLHVRGVLFTWTQLWNSHLFSVCGRGVRLLGWLTGYSALLCGCLIVLIVSLHIPLLLMIPLTSILFTCGLDVCTALRYLYTYLISHYDCIPELKPQLYNDFLADNGIVILYIVRDVVT